MAIPSPFHTRTSAKCHSMRWKDWAGYFAVCSYEPSHDSEYFAFRQAAGMIDVSPLFKYDITGPDAARFLTHVTSRDLNKLKTGRVTYLCWLDDHGKVIDDGTVAKLADGHYRLTAAEPSLSWFSRLMRGFQVDIVDTSTQWGVLALQGPTSRGILESAIGKEIGALKFFGITEAKMGQVPVLVSRTGYTGDLGYEIWTKTQHAETVYDQLTETGKSYGLMPAGLDAMDVTRIEAGFIMNGVDYFSAHHALIPERKNSPYELGLGWTVELEREAFIGQAALRRELASGSEWTFVGLDADWVETEELFARYGLPPEVGSKAWRDGRPVYDLAGHWVGMATSGAFSPILKRNLALASVKTPFAKEGTKLRFEITAQYRRHTVTATVTKTPFFNPPRKRS